MNAGPMPRYAMCVMSGRLAASLNCSIARCVSVPGPAEPYASFSGVARAQVTKSRNVDTGTVSGTMKTFGVPPTIAIGVKSLIASYGSLRTAGLVPCVPT